MGLRMLRARTHNPDAGLSRAGYLPMPGARARLIRVPYERNAALLWDPPVGNALASFQSLAPADENA